MPEIPQAQIDEAATLMNEIGQMTNQLLGNVKNAIDQSIADETSVDGDQFKDIREEIFRLPNPQ